MKSLIYTNEYPPYIYGGAGVHVEFLTKELSRLCEVEVRCFGDQKESGSPLSVQGFGVDTSGYTCPSPLKSVFSSLQRGLDFNTQDVKADVVHLHTWYTHFAGILTKLNYGVPMVLTVHSLEPLRPWKREQLGGGYDFSLWVEKTAIEMADAVIAVSEGTKADLLKHFDLKPDKIHVIYNGIDADLYQPVHQPEVLKKHGINPDQPFVLFVGRITRQKGIIHLVNAIKHLDPNIQVVLCAGAPDTPEIAEEMKRSVDEAAQNRPGIVWIQEMLPVDEKVVLYSHAQVFCCPSIYEPFGIINLEAMACKTAVVASAVGGMLEVVQHGETGYLVPVQQQGESPFEPIEPEQFSRDLASRINELMANPELCDRMAEAGQKRAIEQFSWSVIAKQVHALYQNLVYQTSL